MFYIFLFVFLCIYCYRIIIFNIVVKRHEQLVDVSAVEVFYYYYYYYYYYYSVLRYSFFYLPKIRESQCTYTLYCEKLSTE